MLDYNAHRCIYETLHKPQDSSPFDNWLENHHANLLAVDTISVTVNMYSHGGLHMHLNALKVEYPNITNIVLKIPTGTFDSLEYIDVANRLKCKLSCLTDVAGLNFILDFTEGDMFELDEFSKFKDMSIEHYNTNIAYIKSMYTQSNDDGTALWMSKYFHRDTPYSRWYYALNHHFPMSYKKWDELISNIDTK